MCAQKYQGFWRLLPWRVKREIDRFAFNLPSCVVITLGKLKIVAANVSSEKGADFLRLTFGKIPHCRHIVAI